MLDLDKKNILIFAKNVLVLESTGHGARRAGRSRPAADGGTLGLAAALHGGLPGGEGGGHHAHARGHGEVALEAGTRQIGNFLETKWI